MESRVSVFVLLAGGTFGTDQNTSNASVSVPSRRMQRRVTVLKFDPEISRAKTCTEGL